MELVLRKGVCRTYVAAWTIIVLVSGIALAKTDREKEGLVGTVHTVEVNSRHEKKGAITLSWAYVYDAKGNLVRVKQESRTEDGALLTTSEKTHEMKTHSAGWEERWYDEQGMLRSREEVELDSQGRVRKKTEYAKGGRVLQTTDIRYEENRREVIVSSSDGTFVSRRMDVLDGRGNVVELVSYKRDGSIDVRTTYLPDPTGKVKETNSHSAKGSLVERTTYSYDKQGNEIEVVTFNPDNSVRQKVHSEFQYDAKWNWTKRVTSKWMNEGSGMIAQPIEVTTRTISYYGDK